MKRSVLSALLLLGAGCGDVESYGRAPIGVDIRGLAPSDLGFVQIVVIRAQNHVCNTVRANCLETVPESDFVPIRVGEGEQRSLRVAISAEATGSAGQTVEVNVPEGTNYVFVAQALSTDGKKLLAAGCELMTTVVEGDNPALLVQARVLDPVPSCDPTLD